MRRVQFIEIEDMPWCPEFIRKGITDYLEILWRFGIPRKTIVSRLRSALEKCGEKNIVDLCSGGGGPWKKLIQDFLEKEDFPINVCLTDLHPNTDALAFMAQDGSGRIRFSEKSVDATNVPADLTGVRTIFGAFHHFPPELAQAILADAAHKGRGIAIFEAINRSWPLVLSCAIVPFSVMLATLQIRPFKWSRLFWTYLLPVIPLAALFDATVSCLRTYSEDELRQMTDGLGGDDYQWEIGSDYDFPMPIPIIHCIGYPKDSG